MIRQLGLSGKAVFDMTVFARIPLTFEIIGKIL